MSGLKALRSRITSVKSTQKITSAMKMVAAAKLRRAQERLDAIQPYAKGMTALISKAHSACDQEQLPSFLIADETLPPLYIFITADRGLCGSFSTNVMRAFRTEIAGHKNFKAIAIGKKGTELLRKEFSSHNISFQVEDLKIGFQFSDALRLAENVVELLEESKIGRVSIISTNFVNVIKQEPVVGNIVPYTSQIEDKNNSETIFEPKPEKLLHELFKQYFATRFYEMYLQSITAENASRMTAMDSATRNAKEMIKTLQLRYNRTRQAIITKEIIEIISGAEAL